MQSPKTRFLSPSMAFLALSLGLSSCTIHQVGPAYEAPQPELPEAFRYAEDSEKGAAGLQTAAAPMDWSALGDPQLEQLIETVRSQNPSLRAGIHRLQQARSLVGLARSDGRPMVAVNPSVSRSRSSDAVEILPGVTNGRIAEVYTLPLAASWEIDLFGRIQSGRDAALADAQAAQSDWNGLALSLEAQTASLYLALRTLTMEIAVVEEGIALRQDSLRLIADRVDLGAATALDQAQAENQLAQSEADLAALLLAKSQTESALAVLVGEAATHFTLDIAPLPQSVPNLPLGLPTELLQRRPDVRAAERALAAENARIGVAEAAFYPSFTLTGEAGWQASESGDWLSRSGRIWGIQPSLYLPIFQGGRNRANLERAQARYEEVVELYQATVLQAIAEVESALAGTRFLERQAQAQDRAVEAARTARQVARTRYDVGTVDYLNVIESERTALDAERAQVRLLGERFQNAVELFRSMGGPQ